MLRHHGGWDLKHTPRVVAWGVKLLATEPWRLAERWRYGTEVGELEHPPLFILGYYRSGTTHLQEVLLQDPQLGYFDFFQCFFSEASTLNRFLEPACQRIVSAVGLQHPAHRIPFRFDLPAEEDVAMLMGFVPEASNWGQQVTRDFKELYGATALHLDEQPPEVKQGFLRALTDLHWRASRDNGHKRMLFKSPPHTGRLKVLLEAYPDAKFVFIRRDPYDVFASNKRLWASMRETWFQDIDASEVQENILWSHHGAHVNYERDKGLLRPEQLVEVDFEGFLDDPVGTLERIYTTLDLSGFEANRSRFQAYLDRTHNADPPVHHLTAAEIAAIEDRLGPWIDAWGYERRVPTDARGAA